MKSILLVVLLTPAVAFAGNDDISIDRATNVFGTPVAIASGTYSTVRAGVNGGLPMLVLNQPGYTPVKFSASGGNLLLNGVRITTDTIAGTDISVTQDLAVGRDAAITRNGTVGGTLAVTGAASAATLNTGNGAYELFKMDQNVDTTASPSFVAATISGGALFLWPRTKAQLNAITPSVLGQTYMCSDCVPAKIVVSTGTGIANFAAAGGGTFE